MFTGIIENTGIIQEVISNGTNKTFWVTSPLANELKVDQSLSHNGVCLTIEEIKGDIHRITAIEETLLKTNLYRKIKITLLTEKRVCHPLQGQAWKNPIRKTKKSSQPSDSRDGQSRILTE